MKKVTVTDRGLIDYVESMQYEVESHKELITYAMSKEGLSDSKAFKQYMDDYKDFFIKYNMAKNKVEETYVRTVCPNPVSWNLDFRTGELTITEPSD